MSVTLVQYEERSAKPRHCQWELSFTPFGESVLCMETHGVVVLSRGERGSIALCPVHLKEYDQSTERAA